MSGRGPRLFFDASSIKCVELTEEFRATRCMAVTHDALDLEQHKKILEKITNQNCLIK